MLCLLTPLFLPTRALGLDKKASRSLSHYIMGVFCDDLGDIDEAIHEYRASLDLDTENSYTRLNLATSYIKKNEPEKAKNELITAGRLDPEAVEPHAILALLYSSQNKLDLAAREYEIALKNASRLAPNNIDLYRTLGLLYLQQKKFKEAEDTYKLMLALAPNDAETYFYLANVYDELKERQKCEDNLAKALELKPDYHEALNYLGYLYVEGDKDLDRAETMIKKALEMQPDSGAYVDSLGWLYFKQGKPEAALKELERASLLLEDPVIYDHLGEVYSRLGNAAQARLNWQKSLKLDSRQEKVKKKIEALNNKESKE